MREGSSTDSGIFSHGPGTLLAGADSATSLFSDHIGLAILLHMSLLGLLPEPSKDGSGPVTKKLNAYSSALSLCFPTHTVTFLFSAQPHYRLSETNFNND